MNLQEITTSEGLDALIQNGLTLVDFNAPWCGPCRLQEPILDKLAAQFRGRAVVASINVDNHGDLAMKYGIRSIPTIIVFKKGEEMHRFVGLQNESVLSDILERMLN